MSHQQLTMDELTERFYMVKAQNEQLRNLIREVLENGDFCHADNQDWMQRAESVVRPSAARELTPEQAQAAYDAAEPVPLSEERIQEIVAYAVGRPSKAGDRIEAKARAEQSRAEELAQRFHEAYERLAPSFGYETRKESAKPWTDVPEQNKRLMIAVCAEIMQNEFCLLGNQLAAISTVLMANTPITLAQTRLPKDHALYTAAFQDAIRAVEREIQLQEQCRQQKGVVNVLADKLARFTGKTVPDEIHKAREVCIEEQAYSDLAASGGIVDAP
jgi:hypothetical protein